jgi:DNA-binding NarL/FixJ family response regulator
MNVVRVLTVHHEEEVRRDTRVVVAATPGFEAVGEAASAEEALELALVLRPGLVVVGARMPGIDGFETSRLLMAAVPEAKVALLHGTTAPNGGSIADSGAIGTLPLDGLTPASLQALWEKHGAE